MNEDDAGKQITIRKRRSDDEEEHHGGVWKLAFADFMTAMMAFFLVMWLINSTTKETKMAIVQYFNPVQLVDASPNHKGMRDPSESGQGKSSQKADFQEPARGASAQENSSSAQSKEAELHQEPLRALDEIAKRDLPPREEEVAPVGPASQVLRDPFDRMDQAGGLSPNASAAHGKQETVRRNPPQENGAVKALSEEAARAIPAAAMAPSSPQATGNQASKDPSARATTLRGALDKILEAETKSKRGVPQATVTQTDEGLLISLTDNANFSMFDVGSIEPKPQLVRILSEVGKALAKQPGDIEIRGHTDGRSYRTGSYDNWRLSCDRANVAYYMLQRGGLSEARVKKISGYADRQLKAPNDSGAAVNRRIEILIKRETL